MNKKGIQPGIAGAVMNIAKHSATKTALGHAGGFAGKIGSGMSFGLGMSVMQKTTDAVAGGIKSSVVGMNTLLLAIVLDVTAFIFVAATNSPYAGLLVHIIGLRLLLQQLKEQLLWLLMMFKIVTLIILLTTLQLPFPELFNNFLLKFMANSFIPWATSYIGFTGFVLNRPGGLLIKLFYAFFFVLAAFLLWSYGNQHMPDILEAYQLDSRIIDEQQWTAKNYLVGIWETGGDVISSTGTLITTGPAKAVAFFQDPIGSKAQFGETKDNAPPMGVRIKQLNPGVYRFSDENGDQLTFRVELEAQALPEGENVVRITDAWCDADGLDKETVDEFKAQFDSQRKIEMFLNTPLTISCTFKRDDLEPYDRIEFHVQYELTTNAQRKSYAMRDDLWSDLKRNGEDPFTYMGIRASSGDFATRYDAGPIKVGIGPEEFGKPPIPIGPSAQSRRFEVLIGNDKAFNGEIADLTDIRITMPTGISLKGGRCDFKEVLEGLNVNVYRFNTAVREFNIHRFTTISGQEIFSCPMEISTDQVLGSASFAELAFDVTIDALYETTATVSKNREGLFE